MKKRLLLIICLILSAAALTGCLLVTPPDTEDDPPGGEVGRVLIDAETLVRIVIPSEAEAYTAPANRLKERIVAMGASVVIASASDDSAPAGDTRICIGKVSDLVSLSAYAAVDGYNGGALYGAYAIYSNGYSLAIGAKLNTGISIAVDKFIEEYLQDDTLTLAGDELQILRGIEEYPHLSDDEFDARLDYYDTVLSPDAAKEMKALYGIYTSGIHEWGANLYDPEVGGFYYANSSRDYAGFLPDIESTSQLLGSVIGYGAMDAFDGNWTKALPKDIVEDIGNWIYGLQDPDGYFYEPQFGKAVNTSKKGRNLDSALNILNKLGIKPKYGNPLATSSESALTGPLGQSAIVAVSCVIPAARLDDYLQSEAAFLEWLEALNINSPGKSYSAGHTISSVRNQIEAAGLSEFCIDWLNSKQLDNGLWEEGELSYSKLNGLLKISTCYQTFDAPFPRIELGIQACIDTVLLEDAVTAIVDIYNPWVALGILVPNVKKFGSSESYAEAKAQLFDNAEELIRASKEKTLVFRKDDGSFSYFPTKSSATSQGALVSLGLNEGDVNATGLALGVLSSMCTAYEITRLDVFSTKDGEAFVKAVSDIGVTVKIEQEAEYITFDDCETMEDLPPEVSVQFNQFGTTDHSATLATWSLLPREEDESDIYLDLVSRPETGDQLIFKFPQTTGICSVFECDLKISGGGIQMFLRDQNNKDVLMFSISDGGSNIIFSDQNATSGATITNSGVFKLKKDTWCTLRMEYYSFDDGTAKTKIYADDKLLAITDNFIGNGTEAAKSGFCRAELRATISANTAFAVDDVICYAENEEYDESDYTPPSNENEVFEFDECGVDGDTPEGFIKTGSGASGIVERDGDDLCYRVESASGAADAVTITVKQTGEGVMVFETDIRFESMSATGLQLIMGDAIMLAFDKSGSGIKVRDLNARSNAGISHQIAMLNVGEWYSLRIEYYVDDYEDGPYTKIYLDDECIAITKNYLGNGDDEKDPVTKFSSVQLYATLSGVMTFEIDNIYADYDGELEYDDSDYDGEIIGEWQ